ncbi:DUF6082 family protein [Dactylosporangium sp. CS-047395]|uniref:DUF6082 family protein n=1 Tax=Dactylosporangium sp. CS-047395 TaxID=3239936 RepID=UPI003D8B6A61
MRRKQFLYANLVLSHIRLGHLTSGLGQDHLRETIADVFQSPIMQDFWESVREYRLRVRANEPGSGEFDRLCEAAFQLVRTPAD